MTAENPSRFSFHEYRQRLQTMFQAAFDAGVVFLQVNARYILAVLLVAFVIVSIFSCLVIGSVGMGVIEPGGVASTPQPKALSSEEATATFGAEQFYLQLTASARQP